MEMLSGWTRHSSSSVLISAAGNARELAAMAARSEGLRVAIAVDRVGSCAAGEVVGVEVRCDGKKRFSVLLK